MNIDHKKPNPSIHEAAAIGDVNRVKLLIECEHVSLNSKDTTFYEDTVLHYAAAFGRKDVVEFLLAQNVIIDAKNKYGATPLFYAISRGHKHVTHLLLVHGAAPHNKTFEQKRWENYVHIAAKKGFFEIIDQLLQYGANPNCQQNVHKQAALHFALACKQPYAILCLYRQTEIQLEDKDGRTPIANLIVDLFRSLENNAFKADPSKLAQLVNCLYAFLLAGAEINEEWVRQIITEEWVQQLLPIIMQAIQKARDKVEDVKNELNHLGPEIITYALFNDRSIEMVLEQEVMLQKDLGYRDLATTKRFLLASPDTKKEFLFYQKWLDSNRSESNILFTIPPELLQSILRELLPNLPNVSIKYFKQDADVQAASPYTRLGMN